MEKQTNGYYLQTLSEKRYEGLEEAVRAFAEIFNREVDLPDDLEVGGKRVYWAERWEIASSYQATLKVGTKRQDRIMGSPDNLRTTVTLDIRKRQDSLVSITYTDDDLDQQIQLVKSKVKSNLSPYLKIASKMGFINGA